MKGFVKYRRGILEHVRDGRLTPMEFAAYSMMLLAADHRNGHWNGCGSALGKLMVHIGEGERPILIDVRRPPMNEDEVLIPAPRERLRLHAKLGELLIGAFGGLIAALIILWMAAR